MDGFVIAALFSLARDVAAATSPTETLAAPHPSFGTTLYLAGPPPPPPPPLSQFVGSGRGQKTLVLVDTPLSF